MGELLNQVCKKIKKKSRAWRTYICRLIELQIQKTQLNYPSKLWWSEHWKNFLSGLNLIKKFARDKDEAITSDIEATFYHE